MTRILILDDEPGIPQLIAGWLELAGYECSCAADSNEALETLHRERVDLLIQDCWRGTGMDGLELYEHLKADANLRHIPVLFFSAALGPEDTAALRLNHGDEHLCKPATAEEILLIIRKVLRGFGRQVPTAEQRLTR